MFSPCDLGSVKLSSGQFLHLERIRKHSAYRGHAEPSKAGVHCLGERVVPGSCQSSPYLLPELLQEQASPVVRISHITGDCDHNALVGGKPWNLKSREVFAGFSHLTFQQ